MGKDTAAMYDEWIDFVKEARMRGLKTRLVRVPKDVDVIDVVTCPECGYPLIFDDWVNAADGCPSCDCDWFELLYLLENP